MNTVCSVVCIVIGQVDTGRQWKCSKGRTVSI